MPASSRREKPRLPVRRRAFLLVIRLLRRVPLPRRPGNPNTFVIFKLDHIGDFVLATGAIRELTNHARRAGFRRIGIITSTAAAPLARLEFPDCQITALPYAFDFLRGDFFRCLREARRLLPPLVGGTLVCLRHQRTFVQDLLLHWLAPATSYAVVDAPFGIWDGLPDQRTFRPTHPVDPPDETIGGQCLELVTHARLVAVATQTASSVERILPELPHLPPSPLEHPSILTFPFAHHPIKEYPTRQLAKALQLLEHQTDLPIRLVAAPNDRARLDALHQQCGEAGSTSITLVCPNSIVEAARLIQSASLVIAVDSGPAHIATALDRPGVFLIGGGHPSQFVPWRKSSRQRWLTRPVPCYGCGWNCCLESSLCIAGVSPYDLVSAALEVLRSAKSTGQIAAEWQSVKSGSN